MSDQADVRDDPWERHPRLEDLGLCERDVRKILVRLARIEMNLYYGSSNDPVGGNHRRGALALQPPELAGTRWVVPHLDNPVVSSDWGDTLSPRGTLLPRGVVLYGFDREECWYAVVRNHEDWDCYPGGRMTDRHNAALVLALWDAVQSDDPEGYARAFRVVQEAGEAVVTQDDVLGRRESAVFAGFYCPYCLTTHHDRASLYSYEHREHREYWMRRYIYVEGDPDEGGLSYYRDVFDCPCGAVYRKGLVLEDHTRIDPSWTREGTSWW